MQQMYIHKGENQYVSVRTYLRERENGAVSIFSNFKDYQCKNDQRRDIKKLLKEQIEQIDKS